MHQVKKRFEIVNSNLEAIKYFHYHSSHFITQILNLHHCHHHLSLNLPHLHELKDHFLHLLLFKFRIKF